MKPRSPLVGRNQGVRYGGHVWHIQTEDSGVSSPRIFTHLFHEGTILASRRVDYASELEADDVRRLMLAQHRSMLRELESGVFDAGLEAHLGHSLDKSAAPARAPESPRARVETVAVARAPARPDDGEEAVLGEDDGLELSAPDAITPRSLDEVILEDLSQPRPGSRR